MKKLILMLFILSGCSESSPNGNNRSIISDMAETDLEYKLLKSTPVGGNAVILGEEAISQGDPELAIQYFNNLKSPEMVCYQQYGLMLAKMQIFTNRISDSTPAIAALLASITGSNSVSQLQLEPTGLPVEQLVESVGLLKEVAYHSDYVLDSGCFKWVKTSASSTNIRVDPAPVGGAVCSTTPIKPKHARQCGFFITGFPLRVQALPSIPGVTDNVFFQILGSLSSQPGAGVEGNLIGEWDRGDANLISIFSHSLTWMASMLGGIDISMPNQVATRSEFNATKPLPSLRSFGKKLTNNPHYLKPEDQQALTRAFSDVEKIALRLGELPNEMNEDIDYQGDDIFQWNDNNNSGSLDGGDTFSVSFTNQTIKIYGVGIGRLIRIAAAWDSRGIDAFTNSLSADNIVFQVPPALNKNKISGLSKVANRMSLAFRSITDATVSDEITSYEIGDILRSAEFTTPKKELDVTIKMRKLYTFVLSRGLRGFVPSIASDSGELQIESEFPSGVAPRINSWEQIGDQAHFSGPNIIQPDCIQPQANELPLHYFQFEDPTFGDSVRLSGPSRCDGTSGTQSEKLNKWFQQSNLATDKLVANITTLSNRSMLLNLKRMAVPQNH